MSKPISVVIGQSAPTVPESQGTQPAPPVVAAPTRTTLYYGDSSEPLTGLDLAVAEGRISLRAARRLGWAS